MSNIALKGESFKWKDAPDGNLGDMQRFLEQNPTILASMVESESMQSLLMNPHLLRDIIKSVPEINNLLGENDIFFNLLQGLPQFINSPGGSILTNPHAISETFSCSTKGIGFLNEAMNANSNLMKVFTALEDPRILLEIEKICRSRLETGGDPELVTDPRILGVMSALMQDTGLHQVIAATFSTKHSAQFDVLNGLSKGKKDDSTTKYGASTMITSSLTDQQHIVTCCLGETSSLGSLFDPHTLHALVQLDKAISFSAPPPDIPGKPTCSANVRKGREVLHSAISVSTQLAAARDTPTVTAGKGVEPMSPIARQLSAGAASSPSGRRSAAGFDSRETESVASGNQLNFARNQPPLNLSSISAFIDAYRNEASFRYRSQLTALKAMGFSDGPHLTQALDATRGALSKTVTLLLNDERKGVGRGLDAEKRIALKARYDTIPSTIENSYRDTEDLNGLNIDVNSPSIGKLNVSSSNFDHKKNTNDLAGIQHQNHYVGGSNLNASLNGTAKELRSALKKSSGPVSSHPPPGSRSMKTSGRRGSILNFGAI